MLTMPMSTYREAACDALQEMLCELLLLPLLSDVCCQSMEGAEERRKNDD